MTALNFEEAPDTFIGKSLIHQTGLFARRQFEVGEVVCCYTHTSVEWKRVSWADLRKRSDIVGSCWFVGESDEYVRIGSNGSVFMRANHSRNPNTIWTPLCQVLKACRVIQIGEEITYDYRLEVGPDWLKTNPPDWA